MDYFLLGLLNPSLAKQKNRTRQWQPDAFWTLTLACLLWWKWEKWFPLSPRCPVPHSVEAVGLEQESCPLALLFRTEKTHSVNIRWWPELMSKGMGLGCGPMIQLIFSILEAPALLSSTRDQGARDICPRDLKHWGFGIPRCSVFKDTGLVYWIWCLQFLLFTLLALLVKRQKDGSKGDSLSNVPWGLNSWYSKQDWQIK